MKNSARMFAFIIFFKSLIPTFSLADNVCNSSELKRQNIFINNIPERVQWKGNNGYCGAVSLISAGLYFGQYVSQFDARKFANMDFKDKSQKNQILIGYFKKKNLYKDLNNNITNAAKNMHLNFEEFDNSNSSTPTLTFLSWVKTHVIKRNPVIVGVYENASIFGEQIVKYEEDYDHIVPIIGIASNHSKMDTIAQNDDVIYFRDNNLYTANLENGQENYFCYSLQTFQKNRNDANTSQDVYSISNNENNLGNFGIAITGVKAVGANFVPVQLTTNPVTELPEIEEGSNKRPFAQKLSITATVLNLVPMKNYILFRYKSFNHLPLNDNFNKSVGKPSDICLINIKKGSSFTKKEEIMSDTILIYRAIKTNSSENLPPPCF